ncbi:MAG TPA: asparagine synthase (glutamine-hydrolyzing) [Rhizomicrobium sp.]|jgi:asparagine synthase (glutamine-hydrolysing)|nr:asparagine synthase (glutamine-hydrolyzing) [Rhizomicrobium sp.]
MCGIVGIQSAAPFDRSRLTAAIAALKHRGPDGDGAFVDDSGTVGLGHTRLAIIDLSPTGAQPMVSGDGRYTITYNGELYNYLDIKRELIGRGCRFKGDCDTEVLLEGYALLGPAILDKMNGIFAFAIHDRQTGDVFVARDQMGIKPLYYAQVSGAVAFASEIKALEQMAALDLTLDVSAVRKYLTFLWCPGEQTPLKSVKKLEPGTAMLLRNGTVARSWQYWTPPRYQPRANWSAKDCAQELRALLDKCVDRQMVADAPIGAFLSGGLDSTAVVAAMRNKARGVQCFTIDTGDAEEGSADDLPYARDAAKQLGVDLHVVKVSPDQLSSRVGDMVGMLDEPLADPACLNVLYISQLAREHGIKVLLSGAGGDDLFSGYRRHTQLAFDQFWSAVPGPVRRGLVSLADGRDQSSALGRRMAKALGSLSQEGDMRVAASFVWGSLGGADQLLSGDAKNEIRDDDVFEPFERVMAVQPDEPALEKCLALERRFFLSDHNLTYTDKMGMAAGVEVRVPLIDLDLVQFASEIPVDLKCRWLKPKWILKESQRGVLPNSVIDRPKTGFGAPLRRWLKHDMREMADELLSPKTLNARGLFDASAVARLRQDDMSGRRDGSYTLFSVMCMELWCRRFVDGAATTGAVNALAV